MLTHRGAKATRKAAFSQANLTYLPCDTNAFINIAHLVFWPPAWCWLRRITFTGLSVSHIIGAVG
jgi:hypothetical protein